MLQAGLHKFTLFETDPTFTGVFIVRVKVLDTKSTYVHQDLTFQVTLLCTKSIVLLTDEIVDVSRLMEIDPPQTFSYNMPTYEVNP